MARLYSNENFPLPVVLELRRLGHDVVTTQEAGLANENRSLGNSFESTDLDERIPIGRASTVRLKAKGARARRRCARQQVQPTSSST